MDTPNANNRRSANKSSGFPLWSKVLLQSYVALIGILIVSAVADGIPALAGLIGRPAGLSFSALPIGLAHVAVWLNSTSIFDRYFLVWDSTDGQKVQSTALALAHPVLFLASVAWPKFWVVALAVLIGAITLRNILALSHHPSGLPPAKVLPEWVRRSFWGLGLTVALGGTLLYLSSDWFFRGWLSMDPTSPAAAHLIKYIRFLLNTIGALLMGVAMLTNVRFSSRFTPPPYPEYLTEMEAYLSPPAALATKDATAQS